MVIRGTWLECFNIGASLEAVGQGSERPPRVGDRQREVVGGEMDYSEAKRIVITYGGHSYPEVRCHAYLIPADMDIKELYQQWKAGEFEGSWFIDVLERLPGVEMVRLEMCADYWDAVEHGEGLFAREPRKENPGAVE